MNEIENLKHWERCIKDFFSSKKDAEIEKYLKDIIKEIGSLYKKEKYFGDEEKKSFFDPKRNKKEKEQTTLDFLYSQLEQINDWIEKPESLDMSNVRQSTVTKKAEISSKFDANSWLTWAAENARSVSFSTHVSKLTHSAIYSPSFYDSVNVISNYQVSTSSLQNPDVDGAVRGNQYSPIFQFLELTVSDEKLVNRLANTDCMVLRSFSKSEEENEKWNAGFRNSLSELDLSAHTLLKQIYFPLGKNKPAYHLLCNLVSSSIAHRIFMRTRKEEVDVSKKTKKQKYTEKTLISYPNMASLSVTASNHGNASQLNGKRGGKLKLFSSQPPIWQSQLKPPVYKKSLFFEPTIYWQAKEDIDYLRDFLMRFDRFELSIKDPKRMKWIEQWVGNIIDEILFYIGSIQNLPAGWSAASEVRLKPEHQYLLDPDRDDDNYQSARANTDWSTVVCKDFSDWLNNKLAGIDKRFTPQAQHSRLWYQLFEPELRDFIQTMEFDCKRNKEVKA